MRDGITIAERYLNEAKEYINKGDAVQVSEKLYKAAEENVKALAEKYDLSENRQAIREGRWHMHLLLKACSRPSKTLGDWVLDG
ncbi:PaREP1 family protein [Vulcanisaeta souniana]|uniref:Uncharacterized protein n=1 Tax=Vulcanisaeta souniana JCM 11219 TaxID=1293586 RepID=A0A830E530_9CREN|nr:PaREP1 family protein [Vulcanisaeta souniana]BDR91304.1 hypothetical protein Vsou_03970 [Vulcanisaeta souniana JCM 11219]GGI72182.1 hypothetical protein GCM10007112_06180 [Vulcanisaeta souniana JCM 11219]